MKESTKNALLIGVFIFMGMMTIGAVLTDDETSGNSSGADSTLVPIDPTGRTMNKDGKDLSQAEKSFNGSTGNATISEPIVGDPYKELDGLIGLKSVKEEVTSLANFVRVQKMRKDRGLKTASVSYHCVFTGNPGTGKTTVARILARIYKDLGIVKRGHLVETDRSGLIAEYVGQTAIKTNAIVDSAINGVLFIDEAYALLDKGNGGGYGDEAIATLLKRMEDDRDSLVVIVAGYTNEMKSFINANPGLQSRFTRYIEFPDYSSGDLYEIYMTQVRKYSYKLDDDADKFLRNSLNETVAHKSRNFGNARYVRNLFEQTITNQANRIGKRQNLSKSQLSQITIGDVTQACKTVIK